MSGRKMTIEEIDSRYHKEKNLLLTEPDPDSDSWVEDAPFFLEDCVYIPYESLCIGPLTQKTKDLLAEAMRRGEIGDLRFSNIKGDSLEFWSKGLGPDGKLSVLPMMDNVRDALERYMQKRSMIVEKWGEYDPDAILLNSCGMPMSGDVVYARLKDLAKRSGVDEFTPHSLRRFAATKMRKEGAFIPDIACALRHEDPVTIMRCYLKDDPEVKAITLAKASKSLFAS